LGSIRAEAVNKKRNMLREMDPNAIADYLVKHPGIFFVSCVAVTEYLISEDSELVAQVLKEQTAPPPEVINNQKLNMLRAMETSAVADYLASHPGIFFGYHVLRSNVHLQRTMSWLHKC
jgi:uncharacterized protein YigA (DUF484 family)